MSLDQILVLGLYGFACVVAMIFVLQRLRWRICRRGFRPRGAALGNALHQLQMLAEPQIRYVVEEKEDEESEDDECGGPDDPVRHLHRQARKIRRGEPLEGLTTYLK